MDFGVDPTTFFVGWLELIFCSPQCEAHIFTGECPDVILDFLPARESCPKYAESQSLADGRIQASNTKNNHAEAPDPPLIKN